MSQSFTCPSCGAPLEVEHRFSRTVVCAYCRQSSSITPEGLDPAGTGAELVGSPSMFSVGRSGRIHGHAFRVLGRLRYAYPGGFWDEWFLVTDAGDEIWLQEDDGTFTAFEKEPITHALPPFEEVGVGTMIDVNGRPLFVTETTEAMIQGGEGELRFLAVPGSDVCTVDGNAGGETLSIEYTPDEITLSRGRTVPAATLELD